MTKHQYRQENRGKKKHPNKGFGSSKERAIEAGRKGGRARAEKIRLRELEREGKELLKNGIK